MFNYKVGMMNILLKHIELSFMVVNRAIDQARICQLSTAYSWNIILKILQSKI
jgi:hypothetical protein